MKVVAINSSPHMDKGNTSVILNPFLDGMKEAGAEVEIFYTKKLKIKPCQGEFNCWLKTPGECFQKDDMEWLRPKMAEADVLVLATPLYVDGMTGPMKNLLDRIIPIALPFFEMRDGHIRHPGRGHAHISKTVLVSNCGFWEKDNFDALLVHMKAICKNTYSEFAGALLRPHGPALKPMLEIGGLVEDVIEAAREAGRQLVRDGRMSEETLNTVSRDLMPMEDYFKAANQSFQQRLEASEKK
ncbi:MAG TPA: flavodoxin family protein [Dehalococcoidia bacterium]|nr:flavodoxin family protein [Dehalococcoidia bacterium]